MSGDLSNKFISFDSKLLIITGKLVIKLSILDITSGINKNNTNAITKINSTRDITIETILVGKFLFLIIFFNPFYLQ